MFYTIATLLGYAESCISHLCVMSPSQIPAFTSKSVSLVVSEIASSADFLAANSLVLKLEDIFHPPVPPFKLTFESKHLLPDSMFKSTF